MHHQGRTGLLIKAMASLGIAMCISCSGGCSTSTKAPETAIAEKPEIVEPKVVETPENPVVQDEMPLPDVTVEPDEPRILRFAIVADMNGSYGSDAYDSDVVRAIDMIIEDRPDIVINAGDMVAGQKPKLNYRKMWTGFHATVTDRLKNAGILMAQVPGNHDASASEKYETERAIYIDEWNARKPELEYVDDSHYPLNYSFTLKGVFFIGLDATGLDPLPDEEYAWFEDQLAHNPTKHGAIVFFHVPLFSMTTIKPTETLRDDRLLGLLAKYKVQLVITGHQHAYFPAHLDGVRFLHSGALGGGPRPVRQNDGIAPKTLTFINLYENSAPYIDSHLIVGAKDEHFNHNLLPTYIVFGDKILPRIDISLEDAKFAREYMISPHMTKSQMLTLIEALRANGGDWGKIPNWTSEK